MASALHFLGAAYALFLPMFVAAQASVLTYQDNAARTGVNPNEHILTPATVSESTFGLLYRLPVDGAVYAQPLSAAEITVPNKGVRNVVYVATENNSVYAFDANNSASLAGATLWHVNFGPALPAADVHSGDILPQIGITSTPVIRITGPGSGLLYVVSKSKQPNGAGGYNYVQQLHALDLGSGIEELGGPATIQASVNGTGDGADGNGNVPFNPLIQNNRAALLSFSAGGRNLIAIAWASHGDFGPYHGWIMTYDADSLKRVSVLNTTPNAVSSGDGFPIAAGGIWQSGGGLAFDGARLFCATGNGTFDPTTGAYGDSVLRLTPDLSIADYFTPYNQQTMDDNDADLGSSGVLILPNDQVYNPAATLLVQAGKQGTVHLLNRANLGQFNPNGDQIFGELPVAMHGVWGSPAYFNGSIFYGPIDEPLVAFNIKNGAFVGSGFQESSANLFHAPAPTPTVSSNGAAGGIVWAVDAKQYVGSGNPGPAQLWAYDAANLHDLLYSSQTSNQRDVMGTAVKFSVPLVEGGRVFAGTQNEIDVFGLCKYAADPVIGVKSGSYSNAVIVTATDATPGAKMFYTLDGSIPTQYSALFNGALTITKDATFQVKAFEPGYGPSGVATAYYLINPVAGAGNGLSASYYNNSTASGAVAATEIDPTINFDWALQPPANGVNATGWSANWTGYVQAIGTGKYAFFTNSIGGVRVWVNGQEVINDWAIHSADTFDAASTSISMTAGQKYPIQVQYRQGGGNSLLELSWSSPGLPLEIVPGADSYSH